MASGKDDDIHGCGVWQRRSAADRGAEGLRRGRQPDHRPRGGAHRRRRRQRLGRGDRAAAGFALAASGDCCRSPPRSHSPLALGAIAGAAATTGLLRDTSPSPDAADAARALQTSVAQIGSELATLKAGIASAQRNSSAQFGKLTERLDRTEKAQAEPTAKLAKIQESIDRLERRQQQAAATPAPSPEVTGSVTPKEETKPQIAEGWRLRDFYDGRAIVESRDGTLFRVIPGSNVPGLGRVESIKRENGKVVVTTAKGIIAASLEPRRPAYYYR